MFTREQQQAHGVLVVVFILKILTRLAGIRGLNTAALLGVSAVISRSLVSLSHYAPSFTAPDGEARWPFRRGACG